MTTPRGWDCSRDGSGGLRFSRAGGPQLAAPEVVAGRYYVEDVLSASGGFGVIFAAVDGRLGNRHVLVKARRYPPELFRFPRDQARDEQIAQLRRQTRFEWECLVRFRQRGESRIPNVNDVCEGFAPALAGPHRGHDDRVWMLDDPALVQSEPYIILQAIPGRSLDADLDKRRQDPHWEKQVLQLALELCTILEGFHRPGEVRHAYFIYQDLKPSNIIISHDEFFTLIDFGAMTLVMDDATGRRCSNWEDMGSPGLGTWGYKAPEMDPQKGGLNHLDRRVDVYALGATLWHLLTGKDPSQQPGEYGPLPIQGLQTRSPLTTSLVRKAQEADRDRRYAHMADMRHDILEALKDLRRR
jgi:serine/threonine protein kinase